jgi:sporulation integral membrane protein YtvI
LSAAEPQAGIRMSNFWKNKIIYVKAVTNLIFFVVGVLAIIYLAPKLLIFFMPFVIGAIIAWISNPLVRFIERKLKVRRKTGTAVVIIAVIAVVVIMGYLLVAWIINQIIGLITEWPQIWEDIQREVLAIVERINNLIEYLPEDMQATFLTLQENMGEYLGDMVTTIGTPTFEAVGGFFRNLPSIIVSIVMCLLSAYFFIAEREYIHTTVLKGVSPGLADKWRLINNSIKHSIGGYFKAQLKIEVWVLLLMVIGFFILKVDYAIVIALGIALLDFFPIFGTGTVLLPWAIVKFFNADYVSFIGLLLIWGIGQIVRQIIQPKIMGDTIGVPPIQTLFLLYIGFRLGGVMGMIVALPIGIILFNLYKAGVFESSKKSLKIIFDGLNRFRRLEEPEDMDALVDNNKPK